MRLAGKLAKWQQAGLLTATQAAAILEHEKRNPGFSWYLGLVFLGVFAIVIGILSIIAGNWQLLPGWLKLAMHLLLNTLLAAALLGTQLRQRTLAREACLLAWFGLTLTLIGLIGQVFQLDGDAAPALTLWMLLTTPAVVALGTTRVVLVPWLLGLLLTLVLAYLEFAYPVLRSAPMLPWLLFGVWLPLAFAALATLPLLAGKLELRRLLLLAASLLPIVTASVVCQFWYSTDLRQPLLTATDWLVVLTLPLLTGVCVCYSRLDVPAWLERTANLRLLLLAALAAIALPFLLPWPDSSLLAAFSFIALWLLLGYLGHRTHATRLTALAILVVTLRIYIIYLEVLGSLLNTGFGLVASGLVLLAMLKLARVLNRNVQAVPESSAGASR